MKLRQLFNLHTNMRPCKSYPGNPLNYRGTAIANPGGGEVTIDQVVFRENTEGSYGGVEFFPLPEVGLHRAVRQPQDEAVEGQGPGQRRALHAHRQRAGLHEHLPPGV